MSEGVLSFFVLAVGELTMAENNASINEIPWDCSCGGTDDLDSVVCTSCNTRHHVACAFTLLRGSDDTVRTFILGH